MKRAVLVSTTTIAFIGIGASVFFYTHRPVESSKAVPRPASLVHTQPPLPAEPSEMSTPKYFQVTSLGIRSPIIEVGTTSSNDMATPNSNTEAGWYKHGAIPGNAGMAVLAAHTGPPEQPTIFRNVEALKKGDTIEVQDSQNTAQFEVIETAVYTPEDAPRNRIFGTSTVARLAIITCTGRWNPGNQTYSHRLVIYTVRKS